MVLTRLAREIQRHRARASGKTCNTSQIDRSNVDVVEALTAGVLTYDVDRTSTVNGQTVGLSSSQSQSVTSSYLNRSTRYGKPSTKNA